MAIFKTDIATSRHPPFQVRAEVVKIKAPRDVCVIVGVTAGITAIWGVRNGGVRY